MKNYIHPAARRKILKKANNRSNKDSNDQDQSKNSDKNRAKNNKLRFYEREWDIKTFVTLFLFTALVSFIAFLTIVHFVNRDFNQASIAADSLGALIGIPASVAGSIVAIAIAMQSHRVTKQQELFEQRKFIQEITNDASDKLWDLANSIRKFEEFGCLYLLRFEEVIVDTHFKKSEGNSFSDLSSTLLSSDQLSVLDKAWDNVEKSIEKILESIEALYKNSITRCIIQQNKGQSEKLVRQVISFHEQKFSNLNLQYSTDLSRLILLKWSNIRQLCDFTRLSLKNRSTHLIRLRRFLLSHPYKYDIDISFIKEFALGSNSSNKAKYKSFQSFLENKILNRAYQSIINYKFYNDFIFNEDRTLKLLSLGALIPNLNLSKIENGTPVLNHGGTSLLFISLVFPKREHLFKAGSDFCAENFSTESKAHLTNLVNQLLVDRGVLEALPEWLIFSSDEIKDTVNKLYSFK